jgi:hypothetical protein
MVRNRAWPAGKQTETERFKVSPPDKRLDTAF